VTDDLQDERSATKNDQAPDDDAEPTRFILFRAGGLSPALGLPGVRSAAAAGWCLSFL